MNELNSKHSINHTSKVKKNRWIQTKNLHMSQSYILLVIGINNMLYNKIIINSIPDIIFVLSKASGDAVTFSNINQIASTTWNLIKTVIGRHAFSNWIS